MKLKKCIHIDIDGTLLFHYGYLDDIAEQPPKILEDVQTKFKEWNEAGHYIIVETARPEFMREITEDHLRSFGLRYDHLLMGLPNYPRVLINDTKPYLSKIGEPEVNTAEGIMVRRNGGLKNVII